MDWGLLGWLLGSIGSPTVIGIAVGMYYRVQFRYDLEEAKALARRMYLEVDDARYELDQVSRVLDTVDTDSPTSEIWASRSTPQHQSGKHRLR